MCQFSAENGNSTEEQENGASPERAQNKKDKQRKKD